jgi:hypothetical protein
MIVPARRLPTDLQQENLVLCLYGQTTTIRSPRPLTIRRSHPDHKSPSFKQNFTSLRRSHRYNMCSYGRIARPRMLAGVGALNETAIVRSQEFFKLWSQFLKLVKDFSSSHVLCTLKKNGPTIRDAGARTKSCARHEGRNTNSVPS